jgi:hypothetical protein
MIQTTTTLNLSYNFDRSYAFHKTLSIGSCSRNYLKRTSGKVRTGWYVRHDMVHFIYMHYLLVLDRHREAGLP